MLRKARKRRAARKTHAVSVADSRRRAASTSSHDVTVEDGAGVIGFGIRGSCCVLRIVRPVGLTWPWDEGTSGSYYLVLGASVEERQRIDRAVGTMVRSLSADRSEVVAGLQPLLDLFPTGDYRIMISGEFGQAELAYSAPEIHAPGVDLGGSDTSAANDASEIHEHLAGGAWEGGEEVFYFTQPMASLDEGVITSWQERIEAGERPAAITASAGIGWTGPGRVHHGVQTSEFVIDGHHKLVAYDRLRIPCATIGIHQQLRRRDEIDMTDTQFADLQRRLPLVQREMLRAHWG